MVPGPGSSATAREPWQAGDLMLVDNVRTAHSREPLEGLRVLQRTRWVTRRTVD